jgi:hypothetical protein
VSGNDRAGLGSRLVATYAAQRHAAGMAAEGLREALDSYVQAQDELVEARNRLAQAIAGAAMSGLTQDEIVELTGYTADRVLRICTDAGISEVGSEP